MGDPFSVAGTAVGITSLGIQTFQVLYQYYSQYEGFHDDIDSVLHQADGLCAILESVHKTKDRIEVDSHGPSSQLLLALDACKEALERLRLMLDKCNTTTSAEGISARLRDVSKRVLWPFRKETLREIQSALNIFQSNLTLALQSAGLDGMLRRLDGLQPVLHNLQDQTSRVEKDLIGQTETLEVIQQGVEKISISQNQYGLSMANELSEIRAELRAGVSQQTQALEIMCSMLVRSQISKDPTTIPPTLLAEATQIVETTSPQVEESLRRYQSRTNEIQMRHKPSAVNDLCGCRVKRSRIVKCRGWFTTTSEEEQSHQPDCPLFSHSRYSKIVVAQATICTTFIRFCVEIGWQCSRRGGWNSVAPLLRYRAVVSGNSGVFKLHNETFMRLWGESNRESVDVIFSDFAAALPRSLVQAGQPTDVDETGRTVFAAILESILDFVTRDLLEPEALCSLLDTCILNGMPHEETCHRGLTPIMLIQESILEFHRRPEQIETLKKLLAHLIRRSRSWGVLLHGYHPQFLLGSESLYGLIPELLEIEEIDDKSDDIDPLLQGILRRSIEAFDSSLKATSVEVRIQLLQSDDYVTPLASWSAGVDLLLSKNYHHGSKSVVDALWGMAVAFSVLKSIEILLLYEPNVDIGDWTELNRRYFHRFPENCLRWSKVFGTIAGRLSNKYKPNTHPTHEASSFPPKELSLFNAPSLTIAAAEGAWSAGFRDLGFMSLWNCSSRNLFRDPTQVISREYLLLKWLLEHGADPFQTHPRFLTTPLHVFFRGACLRFQGSGRIHIPKEFDWLWQMGEVLDSCRCYCSAQGCLLVGCAVSKHGWDDMQFSRERQRMFALVEQNRKAYWMISAVLRVLTFEELSLTHTCCYRIHGEINGFFHRPTMTEAEIIQDLERTEIDLLEALMIEFENSWIDYDQSFEAFISTIWAPRMQRIRAKNEIDREVYEAELYKIGVVVQGPHKETVSGQGSSNFDEWPFIEQKSYAEWLVEQDSALVHDDDDDDEEEEEEEEEEDVSRDEDIETEGLLPDGRSTT